MMFKQAKVADWMSQRVVSVAATTPIQEARQLMKEYGIRHLPVVNADKLVGVLSLGDIREAAPSDATTLSIWELNYLWEKITVAQVMTHHVITAHPSHSIAEAAQLMLVHKISSLPIVDADQRLVGILTESDIFHMIVERAREQA
jgi:acetoin utilization protein AcuB